MPRYKEYNRLRVTEKAMEQFWKHGYEASSLSVLTQKMNINKFTFYEAFESKEQLLLETMEHYYALHFHPLLTRLQSDHDLMHYFNEMLKPWKENFRGCYILTITAETGVNIPSAVDILKRYIQQLEMALLEAVSRAMPDSSKEQQEVKVRQLLALCTSIPLMYPVKPELSCLEYAGEVLGNIGLRKQLAPNFN